MSKQIFSFGKQLKAGKDGEKLFCEYYKKEKAVLSDCREFDAIINDDERVEIKTDFSDYPNMFIERYGNIEKKSDGSVWKCVDKNIKWFVYFYWNRKTFYWFYPKDLVKYMKENTKKYKEKIIFNVAWKALGFAVPLKDIEHLIIRMDKIIES